MKNPVKSHWTRRLRHAFGRLRGADVIELLANLAWLG